MIYLIGEGENLKEPKRITDILPATLKNLGINKSIKYVGIFDFWEEIVGKEVARFCKPVGFKSDTLILSIENSNWLYSLKLKEKEILNEINKRLEKGKIKKLVFKPV